MEENITRKKIWDQAGTAGLILGLILSILMLLNGLILNSDFNAAVSSITSMLLSIVRIGGYIVVMAYFMGLFAAANPKMVRSDAFRFGRAAAILSALIYAATSFADAAYLNSEIYTTQYEAIIKTIEPIMGYDYKEGSEWILNHVPHMTFFSCLANTAILGSVLAYILSRKLQIRPSGTDL